MKKRTPPRRRNPVEEHPPSALLELGVRMPMSLYLALEQDMKRTGVYVDTVRLVGDRYSSDLILFVPKSHPLNNAIYEHIEPQMASVDYDPRGTYYRIDATRKANPRRRNGPKYERCVRKVKARGGAANPWAVCTASVGRKRNPSGEMLVDTFDTNNGIEVELRGGSAPRSEVASIYIGSPLRTGQRAVSFFVYPRDGRDSGTALGRMSVGGDVLWRDFAGTAETVEEHGMLFDQMLELYYQLRERPRGRYTVSL